MSGSRGPEMIRRGPKPVKPSIADPHQKPIAEMSPKKMGDRRSPRGNAVRSSDPSNQKKLGNRVADLESQLGQAQGELKILKHRLSSTGAKRVPIKPKNPEGSDESQPETDVFEVPVLNKVDLSPPAELDSRNDEITSLKAEIDEKDTEMEKSKRKKNAMKSKIDELNSDMASVRNKETEMSSKLNQLFVELEQSKSAETELKEKVEMLEAEKKLMETEMKMMRVQMDQWKKAAEAAAIVLSEEAHGNRRIDGEPPADDGFSGGKEKGSGIRMFGEIWKKKGQK